MNLSFCFNKCLVRIHTWFIFIFSVALRLKYYAFSVYIRSVILCFWQNLKLELNLFFEFKSVDDTANKLAVGYICDNKIDRKHTQVARGNHHSIELYIRCELYESVPAFLVNCARRIFYGI
jgi:hypothetical protein